MSSSTPSKCYYPYLAMSPTTIPTAPGSKRHLDEDDNTSPDAMMLDDHGHDVPLGRNIMPLQRGRSRTQRTAGSANRTPHRSSNLALVLNVEEVPVSPSTLAQVEHEALMGMGIARHLPLRPLLKKVEGAAAFRGQVEGNLAAREGLRTDPTFSMPGAFPKDAEAEAEAEAVERVRVTRERVIEWLAKMEKLEEDQAVKSEGDDMKGVTASLPWLPWLATLEIPAEDEEFCPCCR